MNSFCTDEPHEGNAETYILKNDCGCQVVVKRGNPFMALDVFSETAVKFH
jgi:hypothetical protein